MLLVSMSFQVFSYLPAVTAVVLVVCEVLRKAHQDERRFVFVQEEVEDKILMIIFHFY